jgi:uncharacterized protein (TIGR03435 family)
MRRGLLGIAGILAVGGLVSPLQSLAQSAAAMAPEFEVASVKPGSSPPFGPVTEDGAQVSYRSTTVMYLLRKAYGVMDAQISGPAWLADGPGGPTFDVVAKIPAAASKDRVHQIPLMLEALLKERFQLASHRDQKTMEAYALVPGNKGLKMQKAAADDPRDEGCVSAYVAGGPNAIQCHIRMADLAKELQPLIQEPVPVVDRTGLDGVYDFKLAWTGRVMLNLGRDGTSIHDAVQQQLGLKLERRKEPVDVIVIDHIEKVPTKD